MSNLCSSALVIKLLFSRLLENPQYADSPIWSVFPNNRGCFVFGTGYMGTFYFMKGLFVLVALFFIDGLMSDGSHPVGEEGASVKRSPIFNHFNKMYNEEELIMEFEAMAFVTVDIA